MRILLIVGIVCLIVAGVLHFLQVDTLHQIIANQKQQLALCQAPKLSAMNCQHYMDNLAADQSVTESCIRMTYRN